MEDTKKYHKYFSPETINTLNTLWDEIGYSEEDKKIRLHQLVQRIQNVHTDFIDGTLKRCQNLTRKTNEIKDKHIKKLEALGASEEEIENVKDHEILGTIKDKYIDTNNKYKEFLNIYNQRVDEFKKYYVQIQSCFKEIGTIENVPKCCNEEEDRKENPEQIEEEDNNTESDTEVDREIKLNDENNEDENDQNAGKTAENDKDSNNLGDNEQNNNYVMVYVDDSLQIQDEDTTNLNKTHILSGYTNDENTQVQGEFAQIGEDDLSYDRLKRFENKANELQKEVNIRQRVFNDIKSKILKLQSDLCEVSPLEIDEMLNGQVYSDSVCDRLTDYQNYLSEIYETRKKYISEMAIEIVKLWDLLDVDEDTRTSFLATHSAFSQKNVQDCINEAENLTRMRNDRLPEIIVKLKNEISNICNDLGYSEEQKEKIYEKCDNDMENEVGNDNVNEMAYDIEFNNENKDKFIQIDDNEHGSIEEEEEETNEEERKEEEEREEVEKEEVEKEEVEKEEVNNANEDYAFNIEEEEKDKSEQRPVSDFEEDVDDNKNYIKIFNNYEAELYRLRKIHLVAQPIIDLINQRQEIIDEYNNMTEKIKQEENSNKQKTSEKNKSKEKDDNIPKEKEEDKDLVKTAPVKKKKKEKKREKPGEFKTIRVRPPNSKDKIYQDKVTRRYKAILPRVEKKLLITLIQFREENGEDFIWKQKPIINELKHIHVTQSEIRAQSKNRSGVTIQGRRRSITTLGTKTKPNTQQRKSLQPSKLSTNINAKSRNQRKSTIPRNPNWI